MNADRKLARTLRQLVKSADKGGDIGQPSQAFVSLLSRTADASLRSALSRASHALQATAAQRARTPPEEAAAIIQPLVSNGFPNSAAVIFTALAQPLKTLDLEAILPLAPCAKCLAAWIKTSGISKKLLQEKILAAPDRAWDTVALDWYLERASLSRAPVFLADLLARKARPKYLPQWDEVLATRLEKATGGPLLEAVFQNQSCDPRQLDTLVALFVTNPKLSHRVADLLPGLLACPLAGKALAFAKLFLEHSVVALPHQRPLLSAAIARLATGILLKEELSPAQAEALISISDAMSRLRLATTDEDLQARTWIIEPLKAAAKRAGDNQNLTLTGARYLAIAFEKARQGFDANVVLSMAAKNLGMSTIGAKGERAPYNPLQHEDAKGGIMPGETVEIVDPGWEFRNSVVLRATVLRPPSTPNPDGV